MSALTSIELPVAADQAESAGCLPDIRSAARPLRLVQDSGPGAAARRVQAPPAQAQPRSSSITPPAARPRTVPVLTPSAVIPPRSRAAAHSPMRLTRRGRAVIVALTVAVVAAVAVVLSLAAAGGAQAANHSHPGRGGYQGMHEIVVRPGQTLWSIASAAEPGADPRDVVEQIMSVNAMTSTDISVGQLLWVPR